MLREKSYLRVDELAGTGYSINSDHLEGYTASEITLDFVASNNGTTDKALTLNGTVTTGSTLNANGTTNINGTLNANGEANIGNGGSAVAINGTTVTFNDSNLTNAINLTVADNALAPGLPNGIVDAINDLAAGGAGLWLDDVVGDFIYPNSVYSSNVQIPAGTMTVGSDGTGYDINFFGGAVGTRFFWDESKFALRAGGVTGGEWDDGNVGFYSVAFGLNSTASGNFDVVSGGNANTASGGYAVVAGGNGNTVSVQYGTISGGFNNNIVAQNYGTISGGTDNTVSGSYGTISGGTGNTSGGYATVSGGGVNTASGGYAAVSGGRVNIASGSYSAISGGFNNTAAGDYSWAGGLYMDVDGLADNTFLWGNHSSEITVTQADSFIIGPGGGSVTYSVGINDPTPSYALDVTGAAQITTILGVGTTPTATYGIDVLEATANGRGINVSQTGATGSTYGVYSSSSGAATANYGLYASASGAGEINEAGRFVATLSAAAAGHVQGVHMDITSTAGSTNQFGLDVDLNSGYTGGLGFTSAIHAETYAASTAYNVGVFGRALGSTTGDNVGVRGYGGNGTQENYGGYFFASTATGTDNWGVYAAATGSTANRAGDFYVAAGGAGADYGIYSSINDAAEGNNYAGYFVITTAGAGSDTGVRGTITTSGNGTNYGGHFGIETDGTTNDFGVRGYIADGSNGGTNHAGYFTITTGGSDSDYGVYGNLTSPGTGSNYAGRFELTTGSTGSDYGVYAHIGTAGNTADNAAGYFDIDTGGDAADYGVYSIINNTGAGSNYAGYFDIDTGGAGNDYGVYVDIGNGAAGTNVAGRFGVNTSVGATASYAVQASLGTPGDGTNNIFRGSLANGGTGDNYGIWLQVDGGVGGNDAVGYFDAGGTDVEYGINIPIGPQTNSLYALMNVANGYVAEFLHDGDNANRHGITIQAGDDDGVTGTTVYIMAEDGNGGEVGRIENATGTFQLVDSSDRRTKTNIDGIKIDGLDIINDLQVRQYNRIQKPDGRTIYGFVAQEAQEVFPNMVSESPSGLLGISKESLIPILTFAMQQQQDQIEELQVSGDTESIQRKIDSLENRIDTIESQLSDQSSSLHSLTDRISALENQNPIPPSDDGIPNLIEGDLDVSGTIKASSIWSQNATWHLDSQGELFVQNIQTQDIEITEGDDKAIGKSVLPAGADQVLLIMPQLPTAAEY